MFHVVKAFCKVCKTSKEVEIEFNPNWSDDRSWAWRYRQPGPCSVCKKLVFVLR